MAGDINEILGGGIGNALAQGAHAGYYSAEAGLKQAEERRKTDAQQYVEPAIKGDKLAMGKLAYGDPKAAVAISTELSRMGANQRADVKAKAEFTARAANAILQADPKDRPAIYKQLYDEGVRSGYDMSTMPGEYSSQIDSTLRGHRAMSMDILKYDQKEREEQGRNSRHGSPGGGASPSVIEALPGAAPQRTSALPPGGMPGGMPGGGFAPPDVRQATAMPTAQPGAAPAPQAVAQAPPQEEGGTFLSADPSIKQTPPSLPKEGAYVDFNPQDHGAKMRYFMPDPKKGLPRRPAMDDKGYVQYTMPDGTDAFYKPQPRPEKPHGPEGPFAGNALDAQAHNIILKGDPSSPEYAAAYAHLSAERVTQDPTSGQITRIKPNISGWARPPAFSLGGGPQADPGSAPAPAPGTKDIRVESGRGKPLDNSARDDLTKAGGPALELQELVKSFDPSFGGYWLDAVGNADNFAKRNLPDALGGADPKGQAQWWQRYAAMSNIERHGLFGSALTAPETAAWKQATATPGMRPDQIKANIQRQSEIAQKALSRIANSMALSGYNKGAIEAATGVKLDDMPSPMGGVPQAAPPGAAKTGDRPPIESFGR